MKLETYLVGRESELTHLHGWLAKALSGERQIVFVTGEPGIGKTTLVKNFVFGVRSWKKFGVRSREEFGVQNLLPPTPNSELSPTRGLWVGWGQCIEHYGAGEAYLPMLEALGRLCREADGHRLIELLSQHAPTWLVQMPALLRAQELETLQRKTAGATRERMLRELAEALEVITVERPLVLVLEDLHWSDVSTLDLLSMLARRQEPARLLVIGTYRPVEVLTREHPLRPIKQELQLHGHCKELALDFLNEAAVGEYLARRTETEIETEIERTQDRPLADMRESQDVIGVPQLARMIHRRTDGNPLFMVNVVDHLFSQGVLQQIDGQWLVKNEDLTATVPENLRQLIEQQLTRVNPEERKVLEAASVAGAEFSATAVAAGVETTVEAVEEQCEELARRAQFLRASGTVEWPDGTVTARYSFLHALYQDVIYARLTARRQQRLHQQIGEREEQGYSDRAREIAAELAMHFERGRDYERAVRYRQLAGQNAMRRNAYQEAIPQFIKGLELLKVLANAPERVRQEVTLQIAVGDAWLATKGYAARETEFAFARARTLCEQMGETPQLFQALGRFSAFYLERAELVTARNVAEQLLRLAKNTQHSNLLLWAHLVLGTTLSCTGEFSLAREHLEQSLAIYDPQHGSYGFVQDPGVASLSLLAGVQHALGYPDQALQRSQDALILARERSTPFNLVYAYSFAIGVYRRCGRLRVAQELTEWMIRLSCEQGFTRFLAVGTMVQGWTLVEQGKSAEGITQIHQGLMTLRAIGSELGWPSYLAALAEAYEKGKQTKAALATVAEALELLPRSREQRYEADLYRLKGELMLQKSDVRSPTSEVSKSQIPNPKKKPKPVSSRPSTLPVSNKPNPSNSAPLQASPVSGNNKARPSKLTKSWRRSTTGLLKVLTPRICKKRKRCWRRCKDKLQRKEAMFMKLNLRHPEQNRSLR